MAIVAVAAPAVVDGALVVLVAVVVDTVSLFFIIKT